MNTEKISRSIPGTLITPFNFHGAHVRCILREGQPWFPAADICRILEIGNVSQAVSYLDADEVETVTLITNEGGRQSAPVNIISESGLYSLILRSRKRQARAFKKWITSELLPSIRRNGFYSVESAHDANVRREAVLLVNRMLATIPARQIIQMLEPLNAYGTIARNGRPRLGFRRPSFTATRQRLTEARALNRSATIAGAVLQFEKDLEGGAAA